MRKTLIGLALLTAAVLFAVGTFAAEHGKVGPERCKMCHKLEYNSWVKTPMAKLKPPVDCETCHGNGADYWKPNVMKDPKAAVAAGLVIKPPKKLCISCHKDKYKDSMYMKTHAHKK